MNGLRRRKRRLRNSMQEVSLTPLIDTALTLLIIFMITTPMMHTSLKVNLPSTAYDQAQQEKEEIVVHVDKQGALSINDAICSSEQFAASLGRLVDDKNPQTVFVYADQGVEYGRVIRVVEKIKMLNGVEYVALASRHG